MIATTEQLSVVESAKLENYEVIIGEGLQAFIAAGHALMAIRDQRLYRRDHTTFEDYCRERWGISRPHAYRLIDAAVVDSNLSPIGDKPSRASHYRELGNAPDEKQADIWQQVSSTVAEPTAKDVRVAVERHIGRQSSNTGQVEWYTPPKYVKAAREVMGTIDVDPASCDVAQANVKATRFYTVEDDGLQYAWKGNVWLNPPYTSGVIDMFVAKLLEHIESSDISAAIMLSNNSTETKWFQSAAQACSGICFPSRRISFIDQHGEQQNQPNHGQAFFYFGSNKMRFLERFSTFGLCVETVDTNQPCRDDRGER